MNKRELQLWFDTHEYLRKQQSQHVTAVDIKEEKKSTT